MKTKIGCIVAITFSMAACTRNVESMMADYQSKCFAKNTVKCKTMYIDIGIILANKELDSLREDQQRKAFLAKYGKSKYKSKILELRRAIFEMEIERPGWAARTFQSDSDYERISKAEEITLMLRIKNAESDWAKIIAEVEKEVSTIPDDAHTPEIIAATSAEPDSGSSPSTAPPGHNNDPSNMGGISQEDAVASLTEPQIALPQADIKAGFDCKKAATASEKLICSDQELASLDVELNRAYSIASKANIDKAQLKTEQQYWVRNSRDTCQDVECMKAAYHSRIRILQQ